MHKRSFPTLPQSVRQGIGAALLAVALAVLAAGCDTSVDPIRGSDRVYSIYGILDAAADTQFVRVEALRDGTPIGAPDTLDARVTLREMNTDREISLRDSFATVGPGIPTYLFWTAASLSPGATYRLTVERSSGGTSSATTTLPSRAPDLRLDEQPLLPCQDARNAGRAEFTVAASGADRLAGAYALYPLLDDLIRRANFRAVELEQDTFRITVDHVDDLEAIGANLLPEDLGCPPPDAFSADSVFVAVATAGPDWPDGIDSLSLDALARPDVAQNVENGAGFVGGIYTDTLGVPIEFAD
jgi:hypothetical protein